jgi:hypothetical protein
MKLTDWYPKNVKPIRVGVYRTDASQTGTATYQHWNGRFWGLFAPTPARANQYREFPSQHSKPKWRGFAEEPK